MAKPEICKNCTHENVPEIGFPCHLCGYLVGAEKSQIGAFKKKQTWGDKIRAMSDEELYNLIEKIKMCGGLIRTETTSSECRGCKDGFCCNVLQWLKSEVKE